MKKEAGSQAVSAWGRYVDAAEVDERLGELKSCMDDINCLDREKRKTEADINKIIKESYSKIELADVKNTVQGVKQRKSK